MNELACLIAQTRSGDHAAYAAIMQRFQDMAFGFAFVRLRDAQLAEDAVQEAFFNAYLDLPDLHEPQAFPGWFRRILIKQIDRVQRCVRPALSFDELEQLCAEHADPVATVEQQELAGLITAAITALPTTQRDIVTLFYISEYSQKEISAFLELPISTVKMRLYHARNQLKAQLLAVIAEYLPSKRPSRSRSFMEKIMSFPVQTKTVPLQKVISMTRDSYIRDLQAHLDGCIKSLMVYAQTVHVESTGLPFAIYHGSPSANQPGKVEICLPVADDIQPTIEIACKELPATHLAYTVASLRQSIYPGMLNAHAAIEAWLTEHGYHLNAPPRETYLNFNHSIFSHTAAWEDPCVEAAWPYSG